MNSFRNAYKVKLKPRKIYIVQENKKRMPTPKHVRLGRSKMVACSMIPKAFS